MQALLRQPGLQHPCQGKPCVFLVGKRRVEHIVDMAQLMTVEPKEADMIGKPCAPNAQQECPRIIAAHKQLRPLLPR
jgi:hypothetical protein